MHKVSSIQVRQVGLLAGLIFFLITLQLEPPEGLSSDGWLVLIIAIWMAIWWMTEAIPVSYTHLTLPTTD
mgnify:CR=1 FL=1